jgi:hypothetical protein
LKEKFVVENCPRGYPLLAAFLDSDENFMVYRRFGFLHARLLLQKQDELRVMEEALDEMDRKDANGEDSQVLQCREEDEARADQHSGARKSLLGRIEDTLLKYGKSTEFWGLAASIDDRIDDILLRAQQLVSSNRPGGRDYNSVKNFMWNKKPLMEGDSEFIYNKDDLITLRPGRETAWLDNFVERVLKLFPRKMVQYAFCSKVGYREDFV